MRRKRRRMRRAGTRGQRKGAKRRRRMRGAGEQGSRSLMPLKNCSSVNAVSSPSNSLKEG